jgi:pyridoxamine 5'-phosphate oxidase
MGADTPDPIALFSTWLAEARANPQVLEPTGMALATATRGGMPSVRMVLLKGHDARGFVFYTNLGSRKSEELKQNPQAALCFHWKALGRQVRVEGAVEQVSDAEADAYYASRPFESRLGAIASLQSRPLESREALISRIDALRENYSESNPPPRPSFWSGWRVVPQVIEFWRDGEFRIHDREVYTRHGEGWDVERLYP